MTPEKKTEIERLAGDLADKRLTYERLGLMNTPSSWEDRRNAKIEYALAHRAVIEAERALVAAINE